MVIARGRGRREEREDSIGGINGDRQRLDLVVNTQYGVQMMCYTIVHLKRVQLC